MRLELSRKAQADLDDIRDYGLAQFGARRAVAYLDAIEEAFRRIANFPGIGAVVSELRPPVQSLGCGQHRIFYVVDGKAIRILRLLHKAMDVERHL